MSKPTRNQIKRLRRTVKDNLHELMGDGHTVFKPSKYSWLPDWIVKECTHMHYSDISNPKETIFNDRGQALAYLEGVYNLTLLATLAGYLKADYKHMMGRGFQARAYVEGIKNLFEPDADADAEAANG